MITAAEKRKYVLNRILELVSPFGFFMRYGSLWRYSIPGENIMSIQCNLASGGGINDITVDFGTFYAKMNMYSCCGKKLFPGNGFFFQLYITSAGISKSIFSSFKPLEKQVDDLIPLFRDIIIPLLPTNNSLVDFLHQEEKLLQIITTTFNGEPRGTDINEIVYAYLSLNQPEGAMQKASDYAKQCETVLLMLEHPTEANKYYNVKAWRNSYENALYLRDTISKGNYDVLREKALERKENSLIICKNFFHIK